MSGEQGPYTSEWAADGWRVVSEVQIVLSGLESAGEAGYEADARNAAYAAGVASVSGGLEGIKDENDYLHSAAEAACNQRDAARAEAERLAGVLRSIAHNPFPEGVVGWEKRAAYLRQIARVATAPAPAGGMEGK